MSFSQRIVEVRSRFFSSVRKRGFFATFGLALSSINHHVRRCATWNPWNPWYQFLDRRYDKHCGVNTAGLIREIPEILSNPQNYGYSPVPRSIFFRMLRQIAIDYTAFIFIDF